MEIIGQHMGEVDMSVFSELQTMIRDGATGREIMRRTIRLGHESHHHSPELLRIMLSMRYTDEDFTRMVATENKNMITKLTRLLTAMGDNLRVTDLEAAARVVSYAFEETMHSVAVFGTDIERERLYEALADMTAVYLFKTPDTPLK